MRVTIVTPTYKRPKEVGDMIDNLSKQSLLPYEHLIIDGTPDDDTLTKEVVEGLQSNSKYPIQFFKSAKGTAIQRNFGMDRAKGDLVMLIDDDVRLDTHFIQTIDDIFEKDIKKEIGGVTGYRTNQTFSFDENKRWQLMKRLKLLKIYEPGRYDSQTGYPINNAMQQPFTGVREVDFMTTACTTYRKEVLDKGIRFDPFFINYGVLEDAHFALRVKKAGYKLLQCGDATCIELASPGGREDQNVLGYKTMVNYYYVFNNLFGPLSAQQRYRFFKYQAFEISRGLGMGIIKRSPKHLQLVKGKLRGLGYILTHGKTFKPRTEL